MPAANGFGRRIDGKSSNIFFSEVWGHDDISMHVFSIFEGKTQIISQRPAIIPKITEYLTKLRSISYIEYSHATDTRV